MTHQGQRVRYTNRSINWDLVSVERGRGTGSCYRVVWCTGILRWTHCADPVALFAVTGERAWRGLGEVACIAGAMHSNPPQVVSLGTFLTKQESTAAGRHRTTEPHTV